MADEYKETRDYNYRPRDNRTLADRCRAICQWIKYSSTKSKEEEENEDWGDGPAKECFAFQLEQDRQFRLRLADCVQLQRRG